MIAHNASTKFVLFDLGKVLLDFDHARACRQIADICDLTAEQVTEAIFDSELQWRYEAGEISSAEFHAGFCEKTGQTPALDDFLRACSDIFALNVSMVPIVAQLKRANYGLGILSNTCDAHWQFIRQHRYTLIERFFNVYALSFELHDVKPNAAIYEKTLGLIGCRPEEVMFIDDREENVAGACQAGFQAIQHHSAFETAQALRERGVCFNY